MLYRLTYTELLRLHKVKPPVTYVCVRFGHVRSLDRPSCGVNMEREVRQCCVRCLTTKCRCTGERAAVTPLPRRSVTRRISKRPPEITNTPTCRPTVILPAGHRVSNKDGCCCCEADALRVASFRANDAAAWRCGQWDEPAGHRARGT